MPRDAVSRTAHVGTVGTNGLRTFDNYAIVRRIAKLQENPGMRAQSVPENQRVYRFETPVFLTRISYLRRFSLSVTDSYV